MQSIPETTLSTIIELRDVISEFNERRGKDVQSLAYRGQSQATWNLDSTLERCVKFPYGALQYISALDRIKQRFPNNPNEWPKVPEDLSPRGGSDSFNTLIYLRHVGSPSPLLDWTRSLDVALYFAFAQALSMDSEVSLFVLDNEESPGNFKAEPTLKFYDPSREGTHIRHSRQEACYTIALYEPDGSPTMIVPHHEVATKNENIQKYILPSSLRDETLLSLPVNGYSLFETEETLAETLAVEAFKFDRA